MENKNPVLVVLAAGMGSRYGGLKQIDAVDGEGHIIIDFSIFDAIKAGFRDVAFIIKREIEADFREVIDKHLRGKDVNVSYVYQELDKLPDGFTVPEGRVKPWGTAHAIACCRGIVKAPFAVINADDYYGANAFTKIYDFLKHNKRDEKSHYAMVGYKIKNTVTEEGTVSRGVCAVDENSMLTDITERTKIGTDDGNIYYIEGEEKISLDPETVVSMNLWGFDEEFIEECNSKFTEFLRDNLGKNPEKCEFYMPSVVSMLINEGKADAYVFNNTDKWYGVTYKEDKPKVVNAIAELKAKGVYPKNF
jgi:dTDP-glucose pyrophosphorylase